MNKSNKLKQLCVSINESATYTRESIYTALKPFTDRMSKITNQQEYDKFLKNNPYRDVIDKYVDPSNPEGSADKLHYQQALDQEVRDFVKYLQGD